MSIKTFQKFIYQKYTIDVENNMIHFLYTLDDQIAFRPSFGFDLTAYKDGKINKELFENAVFQLGMAEIPSYYKAYCPKQIYVACGNLTEEQIQFWTKFYTQGLGEFFYENKIDFRDLIHITSNKDIPLLSAQLIQQESYRPLVLIGGGKDSMTTGEILQENNQPFHWLVINTSLHGKEPKKNKNLISSLIEISGNTNIEIVRRYIDAKLVDCNREGAYNGHIPVTGLLSFVAVIVAILKGYTDILTSNERSANVGNVQYLGMDVNHQYSKSFEFEHDMHEYVKKYITQSISYKSFLRPWYELQIVKKFAKHQKYFSHFMSCNKGVKTGQWCNVCPKCAFVFLSMHAFLSQEEMMQIFGENLFEKEELFETFLELLGEKNFKPFECVGTQEEVRAAFYFALQKYPNQELPRALHYFHQQILPRMQGETQIFENIFLEFDTNHYLNTQEEKMIRNAM